jgi:hypothetical protein
MRKRPYRHYRPRLTGTAYFDVRKNRMTLGIPNDQKNTLMTGVVVAELWREVARARRAHGDRAGAKQAFVNARMVTR